MKEQHQIIVSLSCLASLGALLGLILTLPSLYMEMNDLRDEVVVAVEKFKVRKNAALPMTDNLRPYKRCINSNMAKCALCNII